MTKTVSFDISPKDAATINKIVVRASSLLGGFERIELAMDLTAVHVNGCPLNLKELLEATEFDLCHDILGMRRHLNRDTGKLEGFFVPRFSDRGTK